MTPDKKVEKAPFVPPFVRFVASAIPMVFDDSLSYYEALCALWKWLQDNVVTVINNNASVTEEYIAFDQETRELFTQLKDYVDNYFANLDLQDEVDHKLDEMVEDGTLEALIQQYLPTKLDNYSDSNRISVGDELLDDSTLWVTNGGWTNNGNNSFTHILNETGDLEYNYSFTANKIYIVDFDVTTSLPVGENASNDFTVVIGNTNPIVTYRGGGSMHYTIALKPSAAGSLKFKCVLHQDPYTASGLFQGTIYNISLKEATGSLEQLAIKDGNDDDSIPFSVMLNSNKSIAIGLNSGITNFNQTQNVYIGDEAGRNDVTGYFNTGVGAQTLKFSVNSTRNTAVGYAALNAMESGDRNTAIGTFAMSGNKYGRKNIAIGFDSMMKLTSGEENFAIGNQSLNNVTSVSNQIAIGVLSMGGSTYDGNIQNIAIGCAAVYRTTAGNNIGLGSSTLYQDTTGSRNIAIGTNALNKVTTQSGFVGIGVDAGVKINGGYSSVIIGDQMGGTNLTTLQRSVVVGTGNLTNMVSLTNSCVLGYNIAADAGHTTLQNVVAINTGKRSMTIAQDNYINIANTIFGDTTTNNAEKVGIGVTAPTARLHLPAGTATAGTAPIKLSSGTLLSSAEDGAFEYDGTHLYFTIGSTRNTII